MAPTFLFLSHLVPGWEEQSEVWPQNKVSRAQSQSKRLLVSYVLLQTVKSARLMLVAFVKLIQLLDILILSMNYFVRNTKTVKLCGIYAQFIHYACDFELVSPEAWRKWVCGNWEKGSELGLALTFRQVLMKKSMDESHTE